jgi:glycosyltransferase involved in cell wall biosynthesis
MAVRPIGDVDVSVIIPLYNRAQLISHTLESLLPHHHPGVQLEIIIVDDGSTDAGAEIAARKCPAAHISRQPHRGAAAARNVGLRLARSRALLFLDSDDLVEPGFFAPRLEALDSHPLAAGAYGPFDFFESGGAFEETFIRPRHTRYPIETVLGARSHLVRLLGGWYIVPSAILWRAEAIREHAGYDEALRVNQDVELLFRMLTTTAGIVGCAAPRALYREHAIGGRQGSLAGDVDKASDLLTVRKRFASVIRESEFDCPETHEALARYCFERWIELRASMPRIAEEFYDLSRSLDPDLQLPGRWPLQLMSFVIGARRAALVADELRRLRGVARSAMRDERKRSVPRAG